MPETEPKITAHEVGISSDEAYHILEEVFGDKGEELSNGLIEISHIREASQRGLFTGKDIDIMAALGERGLPCLTIKGEPFILSRNGTYVLQASSAGNKMMHLANNRVDAAHVLNDYIARLTKTAQASPAYSP